MITGFHLFPARRDIYDPKTGLYRYSNPLRRFKFQLDIRLPTYIRTKANVLHLTAPQYLAVRELLGYVAPVEVCSYEPPLPPVQVLGFQFTLSKRNYENEIALTTRYNDAWHHAGLLTGLAPAYEYFKDRVERGAQRAGRYTVSFFGCTRPLTMKRSDRTTDVQDELAAFDPVASIKADDAKWEKFFEKSKGPRHYDYDTEDDEW